MEENTRKKLKFFGLANYAALYKHNLKDSAQTEKIPLVSDTSEASGIMVINNHNLCNKQFYVVHGYVFTSNTRAMPHKPAKLL